jgi:hypothetical protein
MNDIIKEKNSKHQINDIIDNTKGITYINYYIINIRYELLLPIIKDIQISSQLIKFIKKHQLSDLIFIRGNNSYTIDSRFYFNYRNIIDFYVKVIDVIQTDYFTKIKYHIYKTKPSSKEFFINLTIFYNDELSSKLTIEIILLHNAGINNKILNIINNEFNFNFSYLSEAIKNNKMKNFCFCSSIIKNEFFVLTQIIQNIKLIEYIINGEFKKYQTDTDINEKKEIDLDISSSSCKSIGKDKSTFIRANEKYIVSLKKKKDINDWLTSNKISFKVQLIKIREDNLFIQLKVILNDNENNNNSNSTDNSILICLRKLTTNSTFIFIKYTWDLIIDDNLQDSIKSFNNKCIHNIEKLSKTSKKY